MTEVPHPRKYHCHSMLIGRLDNLFVPDAPARLDNCRHTSLRSGIHAIAEREEGVRSQHGSLDRQLRLLHSYPRRINPGHLSGADPDCLIFRGEYDGIGLHMLADPPGEIQGLVFCHGRPSFGHQSTIHGLDHPQVAPLDE